MTTAIVAEKPSVARDIAAACGATRRGAGCFEGEGLIVTWAIGHLVALAQPHEIDTAWKRWSLATLPMLPTEFPLVVVPDTKDQFAVVRRILRERSVTRVVCATDAGREGELIFRYIYEAAGCTKPVSRLWISSLTREAIREGLTRMRSWTEYDGLADAARGRSRADWLVGMNLSRAYSLVLDQDISVGRVQTPTLAILVERELAIRDFVPEDYCEVVARFQPCAEPTVAYAGTWFRPQTGADADPAKKRRLPADGVEAAAIVARALRGRAEIAAIKAETRTVPPPLAYDLTELQRHANRLYGLSAQRTLDVAQALYERHKLISYPRTDSRHLSTAITGTLPAIAAAVSGRYPGLVAPGTGTRALGRRFVDDAKVTDHHAILPTATAAKEDGLTAEERKIYDLICRRFLEAWHEDHVYATTQVITTITSAEGLVDAYESRGTAVQRPGWKVLEVGYGKAPTKGRAAKGKESEADSGEQALPAGLVRGQAQEVLSATKVDKQTRPPPHHTEATLLTSMETAGKALEEKELSEAMRDVGLGTPATRAQIIETLLRREYVVREAKSLRATDKGIFLISVVHPEVKSPAMTGEWEAKLKRMSRGDGELGAFMAGIGRFVSEVVRRVTSEGGPGRGPAARVEGSAGVVKTTVTAAEPRGAVEGEAPRGRRVARGVEGVAPRGRRVEGSGGAVKTTVTAAAPGGAVEGEAPRRRATSGAVGEAALRERRAVASDAVEDGMRGRRATGGAVEDTAPRGRGFEGAGLWDEPVAESDEFADVMLWGGQVSESEAFEAAPPWGDAFEVVAPRRGVASEEVEVVAPKYERGVVSEAAVPRRERVEASEAVAPRRERAVASEVAPRRERAVASEVAPRRERVEAIGVGEAPKRKRGAAGGGSAAVEVPARVAVRHEEVTRGDRAGDAGELARLVRSRFGFSGFRAHQEAVCRAAVEGRDVLLVMPTGAGKSLCYQLPGVARGGTTLVISPLIALMEDQTARLLSQGFRAQRIHSGRTRAESRQACADYLAGELDFLFIAPERLRVAGFPEMLARRSPALIAVDEAHCISQWGHDFRPDYRMLSQRLPALRPAPIVAVTATATPGVQDDIVAQLGLSREVSRFIHGFRRTNIAIEVIERNPGERAAAIRELLADAGRRPAIVYAATRKSAEELAEKLGSRLSAAYHAGMTSDERDRVQAEFLSGRLEVIVATTAFGMGIDKADVRTIVHAALPGSVEGYYQEIGRAGRDGKPAAAVLMHAFVDRKTHEFFLERDYPEPRALAAIFNKLPRTPTVRAALNTRRGRVAREGFERALEKLIVHGGAVETGDGEIIKGAATWSVGYAAQREHKEAQLRDMARFATARGCRMVHLIRHFGDQEDGGEACGICDVCAPEERIAEGFAGPSPNERVHAARILAALSEVDGRATGRLHLETFPEEDVDRRSFEHVLGGLVAAGLVSIESTSFKKRGKVIPYERATLTEAGRASEMTEEGLALPKAKAKRGTRSSGTGARAKRTAKRGTAKRGATAKRATAKRGTVKRTTTAKRATTAKRTGARRRGAPVEES